MEYIMAQLKNIDTFYRQSSKDSDTRKNCCNYPKIITILFYYRVMGPKDADGMANHVDPDQEQKTYTSLC